MKPMPEHPYRLLAPGPVPVPEAVLRTLGERVLHHRTPQFVTLMQGVWLRLKSFFATSQPVLILTGSGTAAMEAAVTNTLSPGDEALVVVTGKFGERWAEICESFSVHTHRFNVPWGENLDLESFNQTVASLPNVRVVFTQGCETSTATIHPIQQMSEIVHRLLPEALIAIDAITMVGCQPLPMDEWGLDVVIAGSQKAFMIPAGLSFIALSERAWKAQSEAWADRYYFDLAEERKCNKSGDSHFSIPTPLIMALSLVLEQVQNKGMECLWKRCAALSEATRFTAQALGLGIYSQAPAASVTALLTASDSGNIRDRLEREFNITIMGGQDQLKGKILRVGHMGDVRNDDMIALFAGLSQILGKESEFAQIKSELARQLQQAGTLFA
jgi:aspartate aminotransferase-like enzyme